jgi:heme oxygenase
MPDSDLGTARQLLRTATYKIHAQLDAVLNVVDLHNRQDYAALLSAHAASLLPLESALREAGVDELIPDWSERARSTDLLADLIDLRAHTYRLVAPVFGCEASVFGAAYVLEGSRLGAAAMLRAVRPDFPTRYLRHGQGDRLWARFLERLERSSDVKERPNAASAGAVAAFDLFEVAFRPLHSRRSLESAA